MKKIASIFLFVLCGVFFMACAVGSSSETETSTEKEKFDYTIEKQYSDTFAYYIEGVITNKTDKDYSYLQVEFICYDKEGNNIGTALDNTNNLLGNQTWKYKAMFMGSDNGTVDHCDYHEVTGW